MNEQAIHPNFDDERSLLSTRKVVPLNQIDAKVRRRRRWFLGGAFAVAMMLGAASALVASYLSLRKVPTATMSEATEQDVAAAPVAVVADTPSPTPTESPVADETMTEEAAK